MPPYVPIGLLLCNLMGYRGSALLQALGLSELLGWMAETLVVFQQVMLADDWQHMANCHCSSVTGATPRYAEPSI